MDPENIKAIMEWPTPKNVDDVRSFMGIESYFRQFIRNFSWIVYPITSLQRKRKEFEWTKECATSFEQLKHLLKNDPILKIVDPNKEFVVCIDDWKKELDAVLMQEEHVVCCELRNLNDHERNYMTCDLKLEAIIHAIKMCRHYLLGRRFVLMSDLNGLRYFFDQMNINSRKARWLATLSEFDLDTFLTRWI